MEDNSNFMKQLISIFALVLCRHRALHGKETASLLEPLGSQVFATLASARLLCPAEFRFLRKISSPIHPDSISRMPAMTAITQQKRA